MKGFFIKKAFFDGWDNLIGMVLFNIGYLAIAMAFFYGFVEMGSISPMLSYLVLAVLLLLLSVLMGGTAAVTKNYSDYSREAWAAFKEGVKRNIRHSLLFFLFALLFFIPTSSPSETIFLSALNLFPVIPAPSFVIFLLCRAPS